MVVLLVVLLLVVASTRVDGAVGMVEPSVVVLVVLVLVLGEGSAMVDQERER